MGDRSGHPRRLVPLALGLVILPLGVVLLGQDAPPVAPLRGATSLAAAGDAAQAWEARVADLSRAGRLRLVSSLEDTMLEGRVHDRLDQYAGQARIVGGQVLRQRSASGVETVFGRLYPDDLGIALAPVLSAEDAVGRLRAVAGTEASPPVGGPPELVVLPLDDGSYRLAWLFQAALAHDVMAVYLDARTGNELRRYSLIETQAAVGVGTGVLGDRKKLATRSLSGAFFTEDRLRPAPLVTYDMKGDPQRTDFVLSLLGGAKFTQADVAADTDNVWTDGAVVDAHAWVAATYDYYAARFNRRGFDGANTRPMRVIVHPVSRDPAVWQVPGVFSRFVMNAFWCPICGGDNGGAIVFGEGLNREFTSAGQYVNYFSAGLDVVAHEYSHAVTSYSADLVYFQESGALNESFSDIMGIAVEHYAAATGRRTQPGNYLLGEDVFTAADRFARTATRSASNPMGWGQPSHYDARYKGGDDSGGVHINSGISNHVFYLAIEGGTNGYSGLNVQGVGGANREQIERIFYRGFTTYLTNNPTFADARRATLQAARDLYGESSPAFRAVREAWTAGGVN